MQSWWSLTQCRPEYDSGVARGRKVHLKVARVKASNGDECVGIMLDDKLLSILVCPEDREPLLLIGEDEALYNPRLRRKYRIDEGIPVLLIDEAVAVTDDAEHERLLSRAKS